MKVAVYSIQQTLYEGEAEKVICATPLGQMTVLDHHIPLVSNLTGPAIEVVKKDGGRQKIEVASGFIEVRPESEAVILVN